MAIDLAKSTASGPELLVSSALHLMTYYSARNAQSADSGNCVKLASSIERHLKALAGHNDLNPVLRATCQQLSEQWAGVVDHALPRPARRSLFGLLSRG